MGVPFGLPEQGLGLGKARRPGVVLMLMLMALLILATAGPFAHVLQQLPDLHTYRRLWPCLNPYLARAQRHDRVPAMTHGTRRRWGVVVVDRQALGLVCSAAGLVRYFRAGTTD